MTARRPKPAAPGALTVTDGHDTVGTIVERDGRWLAYDVAGKLIGTFRSQAEAMRSVPSLTKQASAILKRARCDAVSGARKDHHYRRAKRAESKRFGRHWRAKRKQLGKLGPASPGKHVDPDAEPKERRPGANGCDHAPGLVGSHSESP
jgi:hypothetical protein